MAKTPSIGLMACPECGFHDAEIKLTKGGLAYRYCPDCNAQFFTRNEEGSQRLKSKARGDVKTPVTVTDKAPPVSHVHNHKVGFSLGDLS